MDLEALATTTSQRQQAPAALTAIGAPFTKLMTNVKGVDRSVDLGPCTAFVGENRTKKTAYLDGVRLALTGRHPAALTELRADGHERLVAELSGPGGAMSFSHSGKGRAEPPTVHGALAQYTTADLTHIIPTTSIGNLLKHGATKGREAIFQRFVELDGVPRPQGMSASQEALWEEALAQCSNSAEPTEVLAAVRAWMNSLKLRKSKDLKVYEEQLDALKREVAATGAGAELIPILEEKRRLAATWESQTTTRQSLATEEQNFAALQREAAGLNERTQWLSEQKTTLEKLEKDVGEVVAIMRETAAAQKAELVNLEERLKRVTIVEDFLVAMATNNVHQCPLCLTHGVDPEALLPDKRALRAERAKFVEMARKDYASTAQGIDAREAEVNRARQAYQSAAANLERAKSELRARGNACKARMDALKEALAEVAYEGPSSLEIDAEIAALRAADHKRTNLQTLADKARQTKATHEAARELEKEAKALLQDLTRRAKDAAENAVNKYLPAGFVAELNLEGNDCEWRIVGTDGRPHVRDAMAGSERGALIIALALAWSEGAPVRILLLDDEDVAGFSKANLLAFLAKVADCVRSGLLTQAFLAWSRPDEVPASWTIIRT
jgi:hypothetical protein